MDTFFLILAFALVAWMLVGFCAFLACLVHVKREQGAFVHRGQVWSMIQVAAFCTAYGPFAFQMYYEVFWKPAPSRGCMGHINGEVQWIKSRTEVSGSGSGEI